MKKSILTITLSIISIMSFSQGPQIGIQASPLLALFSHDNEFLSGIGYSAGISASFPMSERWSIRPELNFQQRNVSSTEEGYVNSMDYREEYVYTFKMKFSSLDMPILFQYKMANGLRFCFGPQFGTGVGTSISEEYTYKVEDLSTGEVYESSGSDEYDGYFEGIHELSFVMGANYTINKSLGFDLRAHRSIALIEDGDFETEIAWTTFQLVCRYTLPIGNN